MPGRAVFISHISTETALAQALKQQLDEDFLGMLEVFVSSDRDTISAGLKWLDSIEVALKNAELLLILCSPASVGRPWVNFEAGAVWLRGIPVIPICHSGMKPHELPVPLSMLQGLEANRREDQQKLYDATARLLGTKSPKVDYERLATSFAALEAQLARTQAEASAIVDPFVLCASSVQYGEAKYGFDLDVTVVEHAFPRNVTVERQLTSRRLRALLTTQKFDIAHLVLAVDRQSGDLIFTAQDTATLSADADLSHPEDRMTAAAFAALLVESRTSLVVLATCQALLLAVEVGHVANMAASDADISGEDAAAWAECFYGFLTRGRSLFKSFELTRTQSQQPIRAIRHKDFSIAFSQEADRKTTGSDIDLSRAASSRGRKPQPR